MKQYTLEATPVASAKELKNQKTRKAKRIAVGADVPASWTLIAETARERGPLNRIDRACVCGQELADFLASFLSRVPARF